MSIQIQPQQNFAIVRQLPDPSDSTTYYVRAVIRNAMTDTLIATVNLTDEGERRFIAVWKAIADISGQGTLISIRTSVYTDAAYSVISTTYTQEIETYLVLERFNPNVIVSALGPALGGGGADIDYKKIKEIFKDVLKEKIDPILKMLNDIEAEQGDDNEVIRQIRTAIVLATKDIKSAIPEPQEKEEVDLLPVINEVKASLSTILKAIDNKEVTESSDLSPVLDAIKKVEDAQSPSIEAIDNMQKVFGDFSDAIKEKLPEISKTVDEMNTKVKETMGMMFSAMALKQRDEPVKPKVDFKQRAKELAGIK